MSASYDDQLTTDLDKARSALGDTLTEDALHSDEHIEAVLTWKGSLAAAIVYLADELVARFARDPVRVSSNGKSIDYSGRLDAWRAIAGTARGDLSGGAIQLVNARYNESDTADEFARPPDYWP